nr:hypothetical protein [Tanacetum cinerariifolium]
MGTSTRALKIGVIGFGPFAHFLVKTMIKQGHLISATSRSDHSAIADNLGVHFIRQILLQEVPEDSDLVCTHPMFGPESGKDGWKDLKFMYERVRVRDEDLCSSFLSIFKHEGCKMLEMSCEEHDRLAAESQFVTHTIGSATSRSDHSAIADNLGVHFIREMEEFMGLEHDVILICTSIISLSEVVKSIPFHCLKKQTLFADVLSVKEHPRQILLQ